MVYIFFLKYKKLFNYFFILFINIRNVSEKGQKKEKKEKMRASVNRLSTSSFLKPNAYEIRKDKTLQYSKYEDARECSFRPSINGAEKVKKKKKNLTILFFNIFYIFCQFFLISFVQDI